MSQTITIDSMPRLTTPTRRAVGGHLRAAQREIDTAAELLRRSGLEEAAMALATFANTLELPIDAAARLD